ncbi:NADH dehydrogenase [ubiquinone] flavoprotein 3, mitochondrial [Pteropus vampyrus]|uniref:NADH dehydrogenase [ubiquinone] flavoprotein 3, mitochondrial n=1 Tax=Pteropus vampyrus TaxID=132908 RepID=A0A6P6BV21_PTEVA|nr:NADH dehydrogenase [ubiquinone] flavoprotein 3, mitochondrial [Pteropus vampyrus]
MAALLLRQGRARALKVTGSRVGPRRGALTATSGRAKGVGPGQTSGAGGRRRGRRADPLPVPDPNPLGRLRSAVPGPPTGPSPQPVTLSAGPSPQPERSSLCHFLDVVGPKERVRPLSTPAAARSPRHAAPPSSHAPGPSRGGAVASPGPDDSLLATDEGVPKVLSRKTLVEFPQKVPSSLREQGSDAEALRKGRGAAGSSSPSSSSSSSSSSSESESDDEGGSSEVVSQGTRRGGGRVPKPEASRSLENRAPQTSVSAKAKAWSPRPRLDVSSAEQPRGAEKTGTPIQPARGRKSTKAEPAAASWGEQEFAKQSAKEDKRQRIVRVSKTGKDGREPSEVRTGSSDQTGPGSAPRAGGGPPAAAGPQAPGEGSEAPGETLEDRPPVESAEPAPVHNEGVFREEAAAPRLAAQGEATEDAEPAGTQGAPDPAEAAVPAEPFDNTTYKNLQHHDYNTYTFLDLNLNLSKFRLPQPSSGRESPRH